MKNILVIYYTQSGQLFDIANQITKPFLNDDAIALTFHEIKLKKPFPFPWDNDAFFGAFPESFLQIPSELEPVPTDVLDKKYDLILFFYQVWYLSPSIPITSFLKSEEAKILLNNTPIVTINGSRNMWIMAQEKVKSLLIQNNAQLKGNIALVDRTGNLISVVTIVDWMFSGIKKKYLGIFPLPGVSEKDIQESDKFGAIILNNIKNNTLDQLQSQLIAIDAIKIKPFLITVDKTGNKIFNKWANFIITRKETRKSWLKVFKVYLLLAIYVISPIVYILHLITYPFRINKIKRETQYYKGV